MFDFFDERTPTEKKAAAVAKDMRKVSFLAEKKEKTAAAMKTTKKDTVHSTEVTKRSGVTGASTSIPTTTLKTAGITAAVLLPVGFSLAALGYYKINKTTKIDIAQQEWKTWTKTFASRLHAPLMAEEEADTDASSSVLMVGTGKKNKKKNKKLKKAERKKMEALAASEDDNRVNTILDPVQDLKEYLKKK